MRVLFHGAHCSPPRLVLTPHALLISNSPTTTTMTMNLNKGMTRSLRQFRRRRAVLNRRRFSQISAASLDLTEDNVKLVLEEARTEFSHIFDTSMGMTGVAQLAEVDGPFVKISLRGRFWHERSLILARLGNYLKQRIPEILEVDIEDEKQLDDSPENF